MSSEFDELLLQMDCCENDQEPIDYPIVGASAINSVVFPAETTSPYQMTSPTDGTSDGSSTPRRRRFFSLTSALDGLKRAFYGNPKKKYTQSMTGAESLEISTDVNGKRRHSTSIVSIDQSKTPDAEQRRHSLNFRKSVSSFFNKDEQIAVDACESARKCDAMKVKMYWISLRNMRSDSTDIMQKFHRGNIFLWSINGMRHNVERCKLPKKVTALTDHAENSKAVLRFQTMNIQKAIQIYCAVYFGHQFGIRYNIFLHGTLLNSIARQSIWTHFEAACAAIVETHLRSMRTKSIGGLSPDIAKIHHLLDNVDFDFLKNDPELPHYIIAFDYVRWRENENR